MTIRGKRVPAPPMFRRAPRLGRLLAVGALMGALAPQSRAFDLAEAWRAAQDHDPAYAAARSAQEAGEALDRQGSALWRPTVMASAGTGRSSVSTDVTGAHFAAPGLGSAGGVEFRTSLNDASSTSLAISARQPLWSGQRLAQSRALHLAADLAELQWSHARQELMMRVADLYFGVVMSRERLRVRQGQEASARQALAEAEERYRIGDTPITDRHEAQEQAYEGRALVLAAQAEMEASEQALADATGLAVADLSLLAPGSGGEDAAVGGTLGPIEGWVQRSERENPELRLQQARAAMAGQQAEGQRAASSPSLDLVARAGRDRILGSGDFGTAGNTANSAMIGIELSVPVYTGGARSARHDEARSLADEARYQADGLRRRLVLDTRSAWRSIVVADERIDALQSGWKASRSRLDATRLARSVGDRSTLDLLRAQSDASQAELALEQARIDLAKVRLRLACLAGALDEDDLRRAGAGTPEPPVAHASP